MLRRACRAAALWAVYFAAVCAATLFALWGVSWAVGWWSGDGELTHVARLSLAAVVAGVVIHSMRMEREAAHAEPESQLG